MTKTATAETGQEPPLDLLDNNIVTHPKQPLTVPLVATLLSKGRSQADIGRTFHISRQAVNQFIKANASALDCLKDFEDIAINTIKHNVLQIVQSVDAGDIKKAGLVGKFTATGIGIEKVRLLEDKSTQNVSVRSVVDDIRKRREELEAKRG